MIALLLATLAVPYLPQTEALCGGAAAAMVFRYLGDRHADVQQFESLVDARAGGIADTALIEAIRARGWSADRLDGSIDTIRAQIAAGHPLILLLEDRPSRYHYVVAVGTDDQHVIVHDPTWGPSRTIANAELIRRWKPAGYWTLLVMAGSAVKPAPQPAAASSAADRNTSACERLLNEALDTIETDGPATAGDVLESVSRRCPQDSAPLRELSAVRFSQRRWRDAAMLAERALDRNNADSYAWDVLGSSRFILDDTRGALEAWNHIGKPKVDSVQITGLTRTRYAFLAEITALTPNTMLTASQLSLARRRLHELPDSVTASIAYRPDSDGFATVNVDLAERRRGPRSVVDWIATGTQAAIDREISTAIPGTTGQGELWEASWRWWDGRPRVAARFSAPVTGRLGGVVRVEGSWEAQTYALLMREGEAESLRQNQAHGSIGLSNWLTANLHVDISSGIDVWDGTRAQGQNTAAGSGPLVRTAFAGGAIEHRFAADRLAVSGTATTWMAFRGGRSFRTASIQAIARSAAADPAPVTVLARIRADVASEFAPLAVWPGAGDGRARPSLLRAHPLLDDGVIEGPAFGRYVQSATVEVQRWFTRPKLPRVGLAVFADTAHATQRLYGAAGDPFQIDVGSGMRVRVAGSNRTVRIDYAHGLGDRAAHAITIGAITTF